jgi:hypothetical protein
MIESCFIIILSNQTLPLCMTGIRTPSTTVFAREELQVDGDGVAESVQLHEPYSVCKFFSYLVMFCDLIQFHLDVYEEEGNVSIALF